MRSRHSARQRSLQDAKRELDSEVHKLNRFVKKLRSSKHWLDQRERKILDFEALLGADGSGLGSTPDQNASTGSSSGPNMSSTESSVRLRSLEAMQQVSFDMNLAKIASTPITIRSLLLPPSVNPNYSAIPAAW